MNTDTNTKTTILYKVSARNVIPLYWRVLAILRSCTPPLRLCSSPSLLVRSQVPRSRSVLSPCILYISLSLSLSLSLSMYLSFELLLSLSSSVSLLPLGHSSRALSPPRPSSFILTHRFPSQAFPRLVYFFHRDPSHFFTQTTWSAFPTSLLSEANRLRCPLRQLIWLRRAKLLNQRR